jgi:hypothetical protein
MAIEDVQLEESASTHDNHVRRARTIWLEVAANRVHVLAWFATSVEEVAELCHRKYFSVQ